MRRSLWILFALLGLMAVVVVGFVAWGETLPGPCPKPCLPWDRTRR